MSIKSVEDVTRPCNVELRAAVEGCPKWVVSYLGTSRLMAMYSPSGNIRGFIFSNGDGRGGWTWFVLAGKDCMRTETREPTVEGAVLSLERFVDGLNHQS